MIRLELNALELLPPPPWGTRTELLVTRGDGTLNEGTLEDTPGKSDWLDWETETGELIAFEDAMLNELALGTATEDCKDCETVTREVLVAWEDEAMLDRTTLEDIDAADDSGVIVEKTIAVEFGVTVRVLKVAIAEDNGVCADEITLDELGVKVGVARRVDEEKAVGVTLTVEAELLP